MESELPPPEKVALVQLVYVSATRQLLSQETILDILAVSRRNNARDEITGMLVYKSGSILQILEGREDLVRQMFDVIRVDPRHHRVTLLFVWPIAERSFPSWTMAFREYEVTDAVKLDGFNPFLTPGFNLETFGATRSERLIKEFIESIR